MKFRFKYLLIIIIASINNSCKQIYSPPAISSPESYLVVEGVVNSGSGATIISLSYTVNLASKISLTPVLNAVVSVQSEQNATYPLTQIGNGKYYTSNLNLDNSQKYRLVIITPNNKNYYSDYVPVLNSPPIDSIYFTTPSNNVVINSATHDPTNTVQYYRWDFNETWLIHSAYFSYFKSDGYTVNVRDLVNDNIYQCWSSDSSTTILLNSTSKLKQALLTDNIITSIPQNSVKVGHKYSILINQYALTSDAYKFWTNLKTNTEQLGSLFDAQPTQLIGNIHSTTNPNEPVIGYISVGSVSSKRIFIDNQQLPLGTYYPGNISCVIDTFLYKYIPPGGKTPTNQVDVYINYKNGGTKSPYIPIQAISIPGGPIIGYTASTPECTDCTLTGTNVQPAFWK
jgi:hypothetical protein